MNFFSNTGNFKQNIITRITRRIVNVVHYIYIQHSNYLHLIWKFNWYKTFNISCYINFDHNYWHFLEQIDSYIQVDLEKQIIVMKQFSLFIILNLCCWNRFLSSPCTSMEKLWLIKNVVVIFKNLKEKELECKRLISNPIN